MTTAFRNRPIRNVTWLSEIDTPRNIAFQNRHPRNMPFQNRQRGPKTQQNLTSDGLVRAALRMWPVFRGEGMGGEVIAGGEVRGLGMGRVREALVREVVPAIISGSRVIFLSGEVVPPCLICPFFLFFFLYFTLKREGERETRVSEISDETFLMR